MLIEITGAMIDKEKNVFIYGLDISEENFTRNAREDRDPQEVTFCIPTGKTDDKGPENFIYLRSYLRRQKAVKTNQPKTWGEALQCIVGTTVTAPRQIYRAWDD